MIRKLLATTALITIAAGSAYAADQPTKAEGHVNAQVQTTDRFLSTDSGAAVASNIIGEPVYTSSAKDAESVGDINDLLVGKDGEIDAAIVGVGGFLGLGEKNVAVSYNDLQLIPEDDGSYRIVLETTKEELQAAPEFDVNAVTHKQAMAPEGKTTDQTPANDQQAMAKEPKATDQMAAADNKDAMGEQPKATDQMAADKNAAVPNEKMTAQRESIAAGRQDYAVVDVTTMSTDDLIGASVYSYNNDNVGEIGEILLDDQGKTDAVVIDVGGFLGIGEKPVAVAFADLDFRADQNGKVYVYTQFTQDQLESAAKYDKEGYKQNRDQMLVRSAG